MIDSKARARPRPASPSRARRTPPAPEVRALPPPHLSGGSTLAKALHARRTERAISDRKLTLQTLSNLLWAACGVNRRRGPFRGLGVTAASASNSQEVGVLVAMEEGVYRFDPRTHSLVPVLMRDLRTLAISAGQKRVSMKAPVQLLYLVDLDRLAHTSGFDEPGLHDKAVQRSYYFVDTGLIAANVYLFAAASGLAAWFHNCDRERLTKALGLDATHRVLFAQSVGYPERP